MDERPVSVVTNSTVQQQHLAAWIRKCGYPEVLTNSVKASPAADKACLFTVIDIDLGLADGSAILHHVRQRSGDPGPIILLTDKPNAGGPHEVEDADCIIQKPVTFDQFKSAISHVLSRSGRPAAQPRTNDPEARVEAEMALWRSPKMQQIRQIIQRAAQADVTVLITGETGTGKDLVARAIHHLSFRKSGPFVKVNCAAVPRELLESELFGHERGAFTGAHQLTIGKFESANRGIIFLDEIGDLHPPLQAKLLHVLQDGEFPRVGGKSTIKVDVRVLAATNQDLERAVAAGRFREDLYYRLNVVQIIVPPLRERAEEIPLLIDYFSERYSRLFDQGAFRTPPEAMQRLLQHRYPGNVRELENLVKRMIVLDDHLLTIAHPSLPTPNGNDSPRSAPPPVLSLKDIARQASRAAEREVISRVLEQTGWNRVKAASLLKISYRALLYKIKQAGLASGRTTESVPEA